LAYNQPSRPPPRTVTLTAQGEPMRPSGLGPGGAPGCMPEPGALVFRRPNAWSSVQAIFCRRRTARNTRLDAAMIFPVNKIPISTVIEGRGAQEMVALVLRPKSEESVRFAHCTFITGGNRRWTC